MIKGKLEADREISPRFAMVGESKFVREGNGWIVPNEPNAKIEIVSLDEAFSSRTERQEVIPISPSRPSHFDPK